MNNKKRTSLIDISINKLMAKLHAAGIQACETKNIIHTGILNWDENATPDNLGKVDFVLEDNPTGSRPREIGIWDEIKFKSNGIKNDKEIEKQKQKLEKQKQNLQKQRDKLKIDDDKIKDLDKKINEIDKKIKDIDNDKKDDDDNKSNFNKLVEEFRDKSIKNFTAYLKTFFGEEISKKFSDKDMVMCYLNPIVLKNMYDKKVVFDDKIIPWGVKEYKSYIKDLKKENNKDSDISIFVCFKIKYSINLKG